MPYLNCPGCRLTVYTAASWAQMDQCPRCGKRLGEPGRLFMHVKKLQRSVGNTGGRGPTTLPPTGAVPSEGVDRTATSSPGGPVPPIRPTDLEPANE